MFFLSTTLSSCGGKDWETMKKTLTNEKTMTTDEFLIKKKEPLALPPDYKTVPKPYSAAEIDKKESNPEIERILKMNKGETVSKKSKASSTEQSILNVIKSE